MVSRASVSSCAVSAVMTPSPLNRMALSFSLRASTGAIHPKIECFWPLALVW